LPQILIGRGNDAHINLYAAAAPYTLESLFLKDPEKLGLKLERKIANLVKKQCAAIGHLKSSCGLSDGAGESSAFMAEEFALEQCARNRRAIESHKPVEPARTGSVYGLRDYFLASTRFASNQNDAVHWRNHTNLVEHCAEPRAGSNQI
jgi:hypothetical protein